MNDMNEDREPTYQGNKIPLFIKIAWIALMVWVVGYLIYFALPDLITWFK